MSKKTVNILTVIGIVVAVAAAMAAIAYFVYRFVNKRYINSEECYEFDCSDCTAEDCLDCPLTEADDLAE